MSRKRRERQQAMQISVDPNVPIRQTVSGAFKKKSERVSHGDYRSASKENRGMRATTNLGSLLEEALNKNPLIQDWLYKVTE